MEHMFNKGVEPRFSKRRLSEVRAEMAKCEDRIASLKEEVADLQNICPHKNSHYECDPSGNYGGYSECSDCGKTY